MNKEKEEKIPETLTEGEQRDLLSQPNPAAPTGLRNLCMIRLMLEAGLRLSEITGLKPEDLDLLNGKLIVRQEREEKSRTLMLVNETQELLSRWSEIRPQSQYYFTTLKGGKIDDRYVREMVKRLAQKAGIQKNVFPHSLRHTFAADLYRKTKNIRAVQKALGHAHLASTMIYTYVLEEDLDDAMQFFRRGEAA